MNLSDKLIHQINLRQALPFNGIGGILLNIIGDNVNSFVKSSVSMNTSSLVGGTFPRSIARFVANEQREYEF